MTAPIPYVSRAAVEGDTPCTANCLCHWLAASAWQRGDPFTDLPEAPIWTPGGTS